MDYTQRQTKQYLQLKQTQNTTESNHTNSHPKLTNTLLKDQSGSISFQDTWLSQWQFSYSGLLQITCRHFLEVNLDMDWCVHEKKIHSHQTKAKNPCRASGSMSTRPVWHRLPDLTHRSTQKSLRCARLCPTIISLPHIASLNESLEQLQFLTTVKYLYSLMFIGIIILTISKNISPSLCN